MTRRTKFGAWFSAILAGTLGCANSGVVTNKVPPLVTKTAPKPESGIALASATERKPEKTAQVPSQSALTLDQIVNAVLVSDPKLRAGFEAINVANADALTASLRPNPTLLLDVQMLPFSRPFTPDRQGGPPQQDVQLAYPIDWFVFGKRAAAMAAASHGVKVSEAEFENLVRLRVTEASLAYYDYLEAKSLAELAQQDVDHLKQVHDILARAVAAGTKPKLDLDRLDLNYVQSRQTLTEAQSATLSAKAKLRSLIGRADTDPQFDVVNALRAPLLPDPPTDEEAYALALQNRPDLQALQWKNMQACAAQTSEKRKGYAQLTPMLGYTHQYQRHVLGQPDADSWTAAVTTTLPIFDRNQGNRARASALVTQTQSEYQAALVNLRLEIETTGREYRVARAWALQTSDEQAELARRILDRITKSYEAGETPLIDYLEARRTDLQASRSELSAHAAYWRAMHRYASATGQTPQSKP